MILNNFQPFLEDLDCCQCHGTKNQQKLSFNMCTLYALGLKWAQHAAISYQTWAPLTSSPNSWPCPGLLAKCYWCAPLKTLLIELTSYSTECACAGHGMAWKTYLSTTQICATSKTHLPVSQLPMHTIPKICLLISHSSHPVSVMSRFDMSLNSQVKFEVSWFRACSGCPSYKYCLRH